MSSVSIERTGLRRVFANSQRAVLLFFVSTSLHAAAIDDIRVSRIGDLSNVEIDFTCELRYVSHTIDGSELLIQLSPGQDCRLELRDVSSDLRRPPSGRMAEMSEVEFLKNDDEDASLVVRFDKAFKPEVKQSQNAHMLTITVDRSVDAEAGQPTEDLIADNADANSEDPGRIVAAEPATNRNATRQTTRSSPDQRDRFVIRVMKWAAGEEISFDLLEPYRSNLLYTNNISIGERRWTELRLGFFETEDAAQTVLDELSANFSLAWITIADSVEQVAAQRNRIQWPDEVPEAAIAAATSSETDIDAADNDETDNDQTDNDEAIPPDRIDGLMDDAKTALVRRDYPKGIALYESLLLEPGDAHRRQAREFLGVAREKNEQPDIARAEYEAYLDEFPDGPDAQRVQQRLATLTAAGSSDPAGLANTVAGVRSASPSAREPESSGWTFFGSASQYYLRGVNLAEGSNEDLVAQSAMLSRANVIAKRRGKRFDLTAQADIGYLYDLTDSESGEQALVSYAYLDVEDSRYDAGLRVGRQRQLTSGILSRFDGIHASYQFRPDMTVNVTAGFPVDSTRFAATSDHSSYGASVDFNDLVDNIDLSVYVNQQVVDGIKDREAIGAQALYQRESFTIVGLLDYDASYNILNTALLNGAWRAHDRLTLNARLRSGVSQFLTTRNAIIGQPINTVRELFGTFSEEQIRELARNRTAEEQFASGGLSAALTSRLQLRLDASFLEYSATVASGGVDAFPETGPQYTYGGSLQGSGFFKAGQIMQLGYRRTETRRIDDDTIWFDLRYPFGERFRAQMRLSYSMRVANQNPAGDIDNEFINPLLRIVYSGSKRYRLELEAGGQWSNREFPLALTPPLVSDGTLEQKDYYVQLGYVLDF